MRINGRKITASLLAAAVSIALFPKIVSDDTVYALASKNINNTCLSTSKIANPTAPSSAGAAWKGSYVYFGKYDGTPIKFRVLGKAVNRFGVDSLFLDSDRTLYQDFFDADKVANAGAKKANEWQYSDLKTGLNGDKFLNKADGFTNLEKQALSLNYVSSYALTEGTSGSGKVGAWCKDRYGYYTALNGEKVFVIDAEDISNRDYGYHISGGKNHAKNNLEGKAAGWWLRNSSKDNNYSVASVDKSGTFNVTTTSTAAVQVAPALNVNKYWVIFSTLVSGKFNTAGAEYKLTLEDSDITIALQSGQNASLSGSKITVPYTVSGKNSGNATRVSVLILDEAFTYGNTNNANIISYAELEGTYAKNSVGKFDFPSSLSLMTWGTEYHVYLLAEDINGDKETDYASHLYELSAPSTMPMNGWIQEGTAWHYYDMSDTPVTGWKQISGSWYLFNSDGDMLKKWQQVGTSWYYLGTNGKRVTGWQQISDKWHFFDGEGVMKTGWQQVGGKWYFFDGEGAMKTGCWQPNGKAWYYIGNDGIMLTGWQQIVGIWYYFGTDGAMKTGWQQVSGKWYFFDGEGAMKKGCWQQNGNKWYYIGNDGYVLTGWQKISGKWYYFGTDGAMKTDWQQISGEWYYFGTDGIMKTGWQKIGGYDYFFKSNGIMAAKEYCDGYWLDPDGRWMYKPRASWKKDATGWYFQDTKGWFAQGQTLKIDGKSYHFNSAGYCSNP